MVSPLLLVALALLLGSGAAYLLVDRRRGTARKIWFWTTVLGVAVTAIFIVLQTIGLVIISPILGMIVATILVFFFAIRALFVYDALQT
jgi:MFS superfamily sulfate permease-like transporter